MSEDRGELVLVERLGPVERLRLAELEQVVAAGLQTFVDVGLALREIRDARLYRVSHVTFEEYLSDRWELGRAHGYRMIDAATAAEALSPTGDTPPNEAQARELAPLVRADPTKAAEVWADLRREHGDRLTAARIRERVRSLQVPAAPAARLERHQFSALLPDLTNRELIGLADSIRACGQIVPIVIYMGQVLDGWQRYRACVIAGVDPRFTRYGGDDPFGLWVSLNIMRQHRTAKEVEECEELAAGWRLRSAFGDGAA